MRRWWPRMTTSTIHYLDRFGRVVCLRTADVGPHVAYSEWPEHVTCGAACRTSARADLIIADRERVAWSRPRTVRVGPLGASVRINVEGTLAMIHLDQVPAVLTLEDVDRLEALAGQVRERAHLLVARQRHRERYATPGAPDDPEHCQHNAARARDGAFTCWTCGGSWPATPEGIAAAAQAATAGVPEEVAS